MPRQRHILDPMNYRLIHIADIGLYELTLTAGDTHDGSPTIASSTRK
jgi:hypothetical protein